MLNITQCDGFAREHPQRPMVVFYRCVAASDGDEMGLLSPSERLVASLLSLVGQHGLDATRCEASTHLLDGVAADVEGVANSRIAPAVIHLQQDLRAGPRARAVVATMYVHT